MLTVVKALGSSVSRPSLVLVVQKPTGYLADVVSASFQIFDVSTLTKEVTPVQVWPAAPGTKQSIDVVTSRLGVGRYAATWASSTADVGRYFVRWFFVREAGGAEETFDQEFEVVAQAYPVGPQYCALYDLREEGVPSALTDRRVQAAIVQASRYVEMFTCRRFAPEHKELRLDGHDSRALLVGEPIVAVGTITISLNTAVQVLQEPVEQDYVKVFNRHLTQGLLRPDDRDSPRIEFWHGADLAGVQWQQSSIIRLDQFLWPFGQQNITIDGVFGYTEPDGSMCGGTPALLRQATKMLAIRNLPLLTDQDGLEDARWRHRVIQENTREQSITFARPTQSQEGPFTGDVEIDNLLLAFMRPPGMAAA